MPRTHSTDPRPRTIPVVKVSGVSRSFGEVKALDNLDIEVSKGSITVLLGPNGAGKTTAIRMITGALDPQGGSVSVFGLDPGSSDGEEVRRRCGVVTAKPSLYDRLSGWDNLRYAAELYGIGRGPSADRIIASASAQFDIEHALDLQVGGYSTGMKTRLALSRAILADPDLLLLDEPTSGLDPESALSVLELIRTMSSGGRSVLMCTHLLLEAEGLADEIVVMENGTSLVSGRPAQLAKAYWPTPIFSISAQRSSKLDELESRPFVRSYERRGDTATVELDSLERVPQLVAELAAAGAKITSVNPFVPTLEDLYFAVRSAAGADRSAHPELSSPTRRRAKVSTAPTVLP